MQKLLERGMLLRVISLVPSCVPPATMDVRMDTLNTTTAPRRSNGRRGQHC